MITQKTTSRMNMGSYVLTNSNMSKVSIVDNTNPQARSPKVMSQVTNTNNDQLVTDGNVRLPLHR